MKWYSAGTEEPLDQQTDDLPGRYWAECGPADTMGRFSWEVFEAIDGESVTIDGGIADSEPLAKVAVAEFAARTRSGSGT